MLLVPALLLALAHAQSWVPAGLPDGHGWKSELDPRVELAFPSWIPGPALRFVVDRRLAVLTAVAGRDAVKAWPIRPAASCEPAMLACLGLREPDAAELRRVLGDAAEQPLSLVEAAALSDRDGDGIADGVDVALGARKAVLLASPYVETARRLAYPGGDVPDDEGVCSDVIVRSLRNAGIDLQREVFEDARRAPQAYRGIRSRNPSIDHRRVRNLVVWFERHWRRIPENAPLLPGDVVFLDTFASRPGPDHVGIVSDRTSESGRPMVVNSWTVGCRTSDMDLLRFVPVTAVYRVPSSRDSAPAAGIGTVAGAHAAAFRLPGDVKQAILVTTASWTDAHAAISAWQRDAAGRWRQVGRTIDGMLGGSGLGWGRGLHPGTPADAHGGPTKREGDGRAPAGVFRAGALLGKAASPPAGTRWPYRQASPALRCVDDPGSPAYNRILEFPPDSAPRGELILRADDLYDLVLVIDHNGRPAPEPGAGSCVFLHPWLGPGQPSPGCTMARIADVARLVAWLDPAGNAVFVQLPRPVHRRLARAWDLPRSGR